MDFRELARIGAEPSPTPLSAFVVEHLEANGPTKRGDLIAAAEAEWRAISGKDMEASLTSRMKKALQMLVKQGSVRSTGAYGRWELTEPNATPTPATSMAPSDPGEELDEDEDEQSLLVEREVGRGDQIVYCYYLDAYRQRAESRGSRRWPIKVGMTTGELRHRMAQHATGAPEAPTVALVIRTDNAALLEKTVHGVLTYRGRRDDPSGGSEWFVSNPGEILEIYRSIGGSTVVGDGEDDSSGRAQG